MDIGGLNGVEAPRGLPGARRRGKVARGAAQNPPGCCGSRTLWPSIFGCVTPESLSSGWLAFGSPISSSNHFPMCGGRSGKGALGYELGDGRPGASAEARSSVAVEVSSRSAPRTVPPSRASLGTSR